MNKDNIKVQILKKRLPLLILWLDYNDNEEVNKMLEMYRRLAIHFKDLNFVYSSGSIKLYLYLTPSALQTLLKFRNLD